MTTYYRFDRFELRPARRQLLDDGAEIDVGGRAFDLLVALVERRDRVVTRDELYSLVWPNVSVELNNLHVQIWRLRNRLGEGTIRTVARQGYQFVADVEAVVLAPSAARVPAWFEPLHGEPAAASAAWPPSIGDRFGSALRRHRLIAFVHDDDGQRRTLLDGALAALPPALRRGMLRYDTAVLIRRAGGQADADGTPPALQVPNLVRAAVRAQQRDQLLILHDAHLAPGLAASVVHAVIQGSLRTRVVLGTRAPLGLQDEYAFLAGAPDAIAASAQVDEPAVEPARALRWRPRGTTA